LQNADRNYFIELLQVNKQAETGYSLST